MADDSGATPQRLRLSPIQATHQGQDRLDSWKAIAKYLGREVRTVQLWEKQEALPIHRHFHRNLGSVFAFRSELDAWSQRVSCGSEGPLDNPYVRVPNGARRSPDKPTIAVLPFDHPPGNPEQERFDDGIVSETIIALQRQCSGWLSVISRTAVLEFKASAKRIDKVGKELHASYLLEGTSQVENGRVRVSFSLVSVKDKAAVWSQSYRGNLQHSLQMQTRVANQVAHCVCLTLLANEETTHAFRPVAHPSSWDAYILGRFLWKQRTKESIQKAIRCFELAIQQDSRSGLAHSGLADCFTVLAFFGIAPPSVTKPIAKRAALTARELEPGSAEAHTSLALTLFHFDHDWTRAEAEFQEAIRCDPSYTFSYHGYAKLLGAKGQHEAARLAILRAVAIDPSPITIVWLGATAHAARHYDEAVHHYQRALEYDANFPWAHMYMAQTLEQMGHISEALAAYERAISLSRGNNPAVAMKAHALAAAGDKRNALRLVSDLSEMPSQQYVPSYDIAAVYAALGEHQQTFPWLNRAFEERDVKLFTLSQDPRFDTVRHRGEFKSLVDRVGLNILETN